LFQKAKIIRPEIANIINVMAQEGYAFRSIPAAKPLNSCGHTSILEDDRVTMPQPRISNQPDLYKECSPFHHIQNIPHPVLRWFGEWKVGWAKTRTYGLTKHAAAEIIQSGAQISECDLAPDCQQLD